ncbi:MAG: 1-deoxy-D-xylulose-5-phosphate reductoisomerase [Spirochaetaceae bacterium]|jgi:1-deoxy-D-xylulose-5-phosphate reductoisomerase|nr:1-deoxy-D-xylulose-5-phosphate reductoisomerase [Spirochaetaceae bacterium]
MANTEVDKKKVAVLGASGSIGRSALSVLRGEICDFEPVLFSAHKDVEALFELGREFPAALLVLSGADAAPLVNTFGKKRVFSGRDGLKSAITECRAAVFVHGISGAAGLEISLDVLKTGADLALANKESVVMGWPLINIAARRSKSRILPVDSEHSAIFKLINAHIHCPHDNESLEEIILTASGGPFREYSAAELSGVTLEDALAHPTWNMGQKITIDSATLANKGLEVIEASRLFCLPAAAIRVVIHRQSIVHSMIRLRSGAVYGELSQPDMRLPIHSALYYPERRECCFGRLEFSEPFDLNFAPPDMERFPMLRLAYEALKSGELYTAAYNAANEAAVEYFRAGSIGFTKIAELTETVLELDFSGSALSLEAVFDADSRARRAAERYLTERV